MGAEDEQFKLIMCGMHDVFSQTEAEELSDFDSFLRMSMNAHC
mgnify:CR=1 FL=1